MDLETASTNLDVLRVVYGIIFAIGLRELLVEFPWPLSGLKDAPSVGVAVVVTLLAIRFFWAVGNIRAYLQRKAVQCDEDICVEDEEHRLGRIVMFFHVPILLLHSFAFYLLCRSYGSLFNPDGKWVADQFAIFFWTYFSLLVLNGLWLLWCVGLLSSSMREKWAWSNLGFAGLAVTCFCIGFPGSIAAVFFLFVFNSLLDFWMNGRIYLFRAPG